MIVLFVKSSFLNNAGANPYDFGVSFKKNDGTKINITKLQLSINGAPLVVDPMHTHQQLCLAYYRHLVANLGQTYTPEDSWIKLEDFLGGYGFFVMDLSRDNRAADGHVIHPAKSGHIKLEISFSEALESPITVYIFSEFSSSLILDKNRNPKYQYLA